jgi:hypothetical protein
MIKRYAIFSVCLVASTILLSGCAPGMTFSSTGAHFSEIQSAKNSNNGVLYIYRPYNVLYARYFGYPLQVDSTPATTLRNGGILRYELTPGVHRILMKRDIGDGLFYHKYQYYNQAINIKSGQASFVRITMDTSVGPVVTEETTALKVSGHLGVFRITPIPKSIALQEMANLRFSS